MKQTVFKGVATALVTPWSEEGGVDYKQLAALIDWQIAEGVDGLVICGTTGEPATMSDEEHRDVIAFAVKQVAGRVPVIAGAGSNDTAYSQDLIRCAAAAGADAMLVVTPYYNKTTQAGLVKSFCQLADYSPKPIIMYNVPSRTGMNIEPKTYAELAEHPNIVGIKEANGDISRIVETMSLVNGKLDLYSGNDDQIVPLLSLGGKGVISVLSNVAPAAVHELCARFFRGDIAGAAALQYRYTALVKALFCEVNPIPAKAAVSAMGRCRNTLRMPLVPMSESNHAKLIAIMKEEGLL